MSASLAMVAASLLFALMGVCVKFASASYSAGEIVFWRSLFGLVTMLGVLHWRRIDWRSTVPAMHFWRSASGTTALCFWFYAIGKLPLATAMTLNAMSSVWIALFLIGGSILLGGSQHGGDRAPDGRLIATVLAGFAGVVLVLRPAVDQQQLWHGLAGLLSGLLAAVAYLQLTALGRIGEPGERVVLYFSASGVLAGAVLTLASGGPGTHTWQGAGWLVAIGLLATAGQWMVTRAYATGATLAVAALQYLGIACAFGFGVWLFDDPVTVQALLGMLLIIGAGVAATLLRRRSVPDDAGPTET